MSGKYFKIIDGEEVDITTLFEEGSTSISHFSGLKIDISTPPDSSTAYARPGEFGYKIKDSNGIITDLSEYCDMTPEVYVRDDTQTAWGYDHNITIDVSNCNAMSGYIVGGAGGGGGGSGGAYDNSIGGGEYNGGHGGFGGGGEVMWFADYSLTGVDNIIVVPGARGSGGSGGARFDDDDNGWSDTGGVGNIGYDTTIYSDNISTATKITSAGGGYGGNGGNRVSTGGSGGNDGNTGQCGGYNPTNHPSYHITHNSYGGTTNNNITSSTWNGYTQLPDYWDDTIYNYVPPISPRSNHGTQGGMPGSKGNVNSNKSNHGNWGNVGQSGFAVLYLKR